MSGLDAKFLYSETATAHMHTVKVAVSDVSQLEGGFSFETLLEVLEQKIGRLPPLRRRAVPVPLGLGHPVWVEDPDFDLRRHVSRRVLDEPAGDRELAATVAEFSGVALARDRPLWELLVVEGLAGGRIAVVAKLHHSVADGSAAVALLQNVVQGTTHEVSKEPDPDLWRSEPIPGRRQLLTTAAHDQVIRFKGLPHLAAQSVSRARASETLRRSFAVRPPVPLHHVPKTSFNVSLTPERTFAMTNLPFADFRAIRRAARTTLNDVYLAVCAGALRRYLSDRGELPDLPLLASVPISTDPNVARLSGNRVDSLYVSIGTDIADPRRRLRSIHDGAIAAKEVRSVLGQELLAQRADVVPPQIYRSTVRIWTRSHLANRLHPPVNVVLSNVAGPRKRIFFGPIELEGLYSVGPILEGIGLNITAWSYEGALGISVLGCPASVPDPWLIIDALHDSLDELVGIFGIDELADQPSG
ncbi:MAG: WS/DGAT/MGAT family O-acyltransferase [Acidimicrobiales bacterium]|jgi:diacylglycerol O-acyltransferase